MDILQGDLLPYLVLGGSMTAVTMLYNGALFGGLNPSLYVTRAVNWVLGMFNASASSGVGYLLAMGVQFIVQGLLLGVSLYAVQRLGVRVPAITELI